MEGRTEQKGERCGGNYRDDEKLQTGTKSENKSGETEVKTNKKKLNKKNMSKRTAAVNKHVYNVDGKTKDWEELSRQCKI